MAHVVADPHRDAFVRTTAADGVAGSAAAAGHRCVLPHGNCEPTTGCHGSNTSEEIAPFNYAEWVSKWRVGQCSPCDVQSAVHWNRHTCESLEWKREVPARPGLGVAGIPEETGLWEEHVAVSLADDDAVCQMVRGSQWRSAADRCIDLLRMYATATDEKLEAIVELEGRLDAHGYEGMARLDVLLGNIPSLPPEGYGPGRCPPGWGAIHYLDGTQGCLPAEVLTYHVWSEPTPTHGREDTYALGFIHGAIGYPHGPEDGMVAADYDRGWDAGRLLRGDGTCVADPRIVEVADALRWWLKTHPGPEDLPWRPQGVCPVDAIFVAYASYHATESAKWAPGLSPDKVRMMVQEWGTSPERFAGIARIWAAAASGERITAELYQQALREDVMRTPIAAGKHCAKREDFFPYCDPCVHPLCGDVIIPGCDWKMDCPPDTPRGGGGGIDPGALVSTLGGVAGADAPGFMARKNAAETAHYARRVQQMIDLGVELPPWVSEYLSTASAMVGRVYHALGYADPVAAGSHADVAWRNAHHIEQGSLQVVETLSAEPRAVPGWVDDQLSKARYHVAKVGHHLGIEVPKGIAGARACKTCRAHWVPPIHRHMEKLREEQRRSG